MPDPRFCAGCGVPIRIGGKTIHKPGCIRRLTMPDDQTSEQPAQERYILAPMPGELVDTKEGRYLDRAQVKQRLNALEADLATAQRRIGEQQRQLRVAWANLDCRCVFNEDNTVKLEDSHCPWHGWQMVEDAPLIVPDLQRRIAELEAMALRKEGRWLALVEAAEAERDAPKLDAI